MQTTVQDYEKWLHREANRVVSPWDPMHDDLVQEGRIAMWKQEVKRGPHAGFMTSQAALEMRAVARGQAMTGSTHKGIASSVKPVVSFDQFEPNLRDKLTPELSDLADRAIMAYHYGEIWAAVDRLPPRQKQAVQKILTDGVMTPTERAAWTEARKKLACELEHLGPGSVSG